MTLAINLALSAIALAAVALLITYRSLGRYIVLMLGLAALPAVILAQWWECWQPGSCDGPGDAFMLLFWGPLALVWLIVAVVVFWLLGPHRATGDRPHK